MKVNVKISGSLEKMQRLFTAVYGEYHTTLHRELPYLAWAYRENGASVRVEKRPRCIVVVYTVVLPDQAR